MNTFSDHFVLWVINVLIHSTVLGAVLLCVAMLFRRRAAMRYWILCCGLLLVLASPAVSALVQSQGSGCLTLALPGETAPTVTVAVAEQPTWANDSPMKSLPTQHVDASIAPPVLDAGRLEEIASTPVVSKPMMVADVRANPSPPTPAVKDSRSPIQWLAIIVTIATVVWAVGATLLLMRMAIGWIRLAGILRRAEPIADPDYVAAFTKACALTGCREGHTPCLVASNEISGPLAAGIFAGSVVLPKRLIADSSSTELAEVFVHEVAHVVRRDQIVVLLQNLVAAIYWPHPLVRKLNRELAKAREEVCDNFVLATTEAPIYSRTLLSLAQLVQQPETIPGSVGFFASRWKLEHRVAGLLDEARDTQTFLSRRGWAFVLASTVGLLAAICVGTVTIATAPNSNEDSVAESEANSSEIEISGIVCEQSGDPIGGATIWLAVTSFEFNSEVNMENREGLLRELGSTDERGRFDFLLDEATTSEIRERPRFARIQIVATSDGHGMDWLPLDVFQDDPIPNKERDLLQSRIDDAFGDGRFASRTLVMRHESQPVRGRIIDLEGNKLSNVTVIVESLRRPNVPQLTNALDNAWKQGVYDAMSSTSVAGGLARSELQKLFPPTKTDENGEFQIRGIGDNQLATLVFQDERIEACPVHVVGREMETLSLPHMDQYPDGTKDLFVGREFNYSAAPSIPVEGTVTDYDTGKPISGVLVSVERLFRREYAKLRLDTRQMRAVTDEQGRFRIIGMPPGDGHIIEAVPPKSEPYLPAPQEVSLSLEDGKTKRIEIQVKRGVWIEGRITDKESGEPRSAAIEYMAMGKNPYAMDIAGWDPKLRLDPVRVYQRYVTDRDGRYRLPGLSGPGVLLVTSLDPGYPLAAGAETIDGYDPSTGKILTLPVPFPASDWHLLKQINPAKDATSLTSDLTLDGSVRIPGRVVGPDGKPISNLYALGLTEGDPYWTPNSPDKALLTERFMVNGYDGKGPRQSFFKNQDETLVGQYRLEGTAPPEIAVKLEPSVRVTGRLIENETGFPAARYFVGCQELLLNGNAPPLDFMIRWCHTNNAGEFEIKGLMAGHVYKMKAHNRIGNKVDFTIDLTKAKPGETIELADVPQPGTHGANDSISSSTMKKSNAVASVSTGSRQNKSEDQAAHSPIRITGRVIDPNGNPVSGAKIFCAGSLVEPLSDEEQAIPLAVSQQNGSFEFAIPLSKRSQSYDERLLRYGTVVATLDGFAPAVANLHDSVSDQPLELRLAIEDEPLSGRILDLQGQPVPKVKVTFNALEVPVPDSLGVGAWRKMLANRPDGMAVQRKFFSLAMLPSFVSKRQVETDAEGRFEMPSFGSGRIVALLIEGPTIQTQEIRVVTGDPIDPISVPWYENAPALGTLHYVANNFNFVAGPTRPITGVVRDLDTGEPLSGFRVSGGAVGNPMRLVETTSDQQGRYRLTGVPASGKQTLTVLPPDGQPYVSVERGVEISPDEDPLEIDLTAPRGVWVEGKVVDLRTGRSAGANLFYFVFEKNQAYQQLRKNGLGLRTDMSRSSTNDDGTFRIAVLPGSGVIAARGFRDDYMMGVGYELIVEGRQSDGDSFLRTAPYLCYTRNYHTVVEVNPAVVDNKMTISIGLDPGLAAEGRVVDPQGKPLAGASIRGTRPMSYWRQSDTAEFKAIGFTRGKSRQLLFWHEERNLAGQAVISPEGRNETIKLQPAATLTARLLDTSGVPIRDTPICSYNHGMNEDSAVEHDFVSVPQSLDIRTDQDGRFRVTSLVPGLKYDFGFENEPNRFPVPCIKGVTLNPGETRDLGDCTPLPGPHDEVTVESGKPTKPSEVPSQNISGTVWGVDGSLVRDAMVAVVASKKTEDGYVTTLASQQARSNALGKFELDVTFTDETYRPQLIVRKNDSSLKIIDIDLKSIQDRYDIELSVSQPLRIRLVDLEGQPADNLTLDWLFFRNLTDRPAVVPPRMQTDANGYVTIEHVALGDGIWLEVFGDERFAPQTLSINTDEPEERPERDATYRPNVKKVPPDKTVTIPLAPSQPFSGQVLLGDTDQPAANAPISIWSSQQQASGSMVTLHSKTDRQGRFTLNPYPGMRYGIQVDPPEDTPYQSVQLRDLRWSSGKETSAMKIRLPEGWIAGGQVTHAVTGAPISGVYVQYLADAKNPNRTPDFIEGWQAAVRTDEEGRFRVTALPGLGTLVAHAGKSKPFVMKSMGSREGRIGQPGGTRYYAHAFQRLVSGKGNPTTSLKLQPSLPLLLHLQDHEGKPIEHASYTSVLEGGPLDIVYRGSAEPIVSDQTVLHGLARGDKRRIYVWHEDRKLGAAATLIGGKKAQTITLRPAGSATMRFVDPSGDPIADQPLGRFIGLQFVMTETSGSKTSEERLLPDMDFYWNFKRDRRDAEPRTDSDGRVMLEDLIPGVPYEIHYSLDKEIKTARFVVEPGEQADLGNIINDGLEELR